jgi:hypothetical protein
MVSMSDPVTIGGMVSLVLSIASEAALKGAVGEAAKDAYKALKQKIVHWAAGDVEALERNPNSAARRAVIAESIDELPDDEKISVKILATELAEAMKKSAAQAPIGIDVGALEAARITLEGINVHEGIGIRAQTIKTPSEFELKDLNVGDAAGKAAQ